MINFMQSIVNGILLGSVYGLISLGFGLVFGVMRVVNFAHGNFVLIAVYVAVAVTIKLLWDPYVSTIFSVPLLFGLGWVVHRYLIRPLVSQAELRQMIITLALSILIENVILAIFGGDPIFTAASYAVATTTIGPILFSIPRVIGMCVAVISAVILSYFLKKTMLGKAIRACADCSTGALLVGINPVRVNAFSFGVGAVCAAIAGVVVSIYTSATPFLGLHLVLKSFVIAIIAGSGSVMAFIFVGMVIGVIESVGAYLLNAALANVMVNLLLIVILASPLKILGGKFR